MRFASTLQTARCHHGGAGQWIRGLRIVGFIVNVNVFFLSAKGEFRPTWAHTVENVGAKGATWDMRRRKAKQAFLLDGGSKPLLDGGLFSGRTDSAKQGEARARTLA